MTDRDWTVYDRADLRGGFARPRTGGYEVTVALDGMHCAACAARAEKAVAAGAREVAVNVATRSLRFRYDPAATPLSGLLAALDRSGLEPRLLASADGADRARRAQRLSLARIGVATICAMQVMMLAWPSYFGIDSGPDIEPLLRTAQLLLSIPGVLWAGWPFLSAAWRSLRDRQLDMNVPVALALLAAFIASAVRTALGSGELYFDTATMFVWFLLIGRQLEGRRRDKASEHLRLLASRRALTAQRRVGPVVETIAIDALAIGDIAIVAPGDSLPADGRLLDLPAELDEALLSGESRPVLHAVGDRLLAGSLNLGSSALALRVERLGDDTVLAQIAGLLDNAGRAKPRVQRIADRIAAHFIAAVLALAAVGAALALYRGAGGEAAFGIALAVLVASCPCALSLAVPVALAAGSARLAKQGVLVANGGALSALAGIDTVLFDKTGTLTRNALLLRQVLPLAEAATGLDADTLTGIAAALERGSRHPIASAFADRDRGLPAQQVRQLPGAGIEGRVDGRACWLGALDASPVAIAMPAAAELRADDTVIALVVDGVAAALFVLAARVREESATVVGDLEQRGLRLELLSGDGATAVAAMAARLGIARHAARQTPAGKLAHLQALQAAGHRVLAVGDGLNDAPLLAAADVSAAMPNGAALTQSRADLLLLGDSLAGLPLALSVAHDTRRRIRENLGWALGYNLLVLPLAMTGQLPPWLAAAGMSLSSLLVVLNAQRGSAGPTPPMPPMRPVLP
ncbi:heavy metal translocating P-type ATPase [Nevskia sp.]|uniref:heavy metal translocating P-type ATPase n=1 Tax=Nevskia sp. TaxID=1929292 RepID=UPI003F719E2E